MHKNANVACMRQEGNAPRIAAALSRLEDTGLSQPKMARLAGVSQSTVNRWSRGRVRPGYDPVYRLAVAVYRRHPDLARELVEASGYAWAEPDAAPEPEPVPEEVLRVIRKHYDPEQQQEIIEMLAELSAPEPAPSAPRAERERSEASGQDSERAG